MNLLLGGLLMAAVAISGASPAHGAGESIQAKFDAIIQEVPENHFFRRAVMRDLLTEYSEADLKLIHKDYLALREKTFENAEERLDYVVTAGGPAAGKSTLLEDEMGKKRAYVDPDRSCMQHMENTFLADSRTPEDAYTHWRDASNFLSNVYLALALRDGYAIAHGSTMATSHAKNALQAIAGSYNYSTTVMHVTCPDSVREASEEARRGSGVVQCTPEDFVNKQKLFFTLLPDYLQAASKVEFYYRGGMTKAVHVATYKDGKLTVIDSDGVDAIKAEHERAQPGIWDKAFN